jgi:AraC family transcriptional regulator of adaptative response / DNA-3-methyladenine glycosylase II
VIEVDAGRYRRSARFGELTGTISVSVAPDRSQIRIEASPGLARGLTRVVRSVRALFDLDAHPIAIAEALAKDRRLAGLVRRRPGLRVPGAFDGFETAVFAVLGQQVSVRAARTLAGRLAERFGAPLDPPEGAIRRLFPDAATLARAQPGELVSIGLPRARAGALSALARAVDAGTISLERGREPEPLRRALLELPGIGPWTADYVCLRVLGWPDAFPAGDLGLRRALDLDAAALARRAERWRPWRGYAAMHLWHSLQSGEQR